MAIKKTDVSGLNQSSSSEHRLEAQKDPDYNLF